MISNKSSIYDNIIATSTGSGGGTDPADKTRITNLENNEFKILYYEEINTTTGAITKPTNSDIILNDFPKGYDAVVETIINGEPSGEIAKTAGGTAITVSSFDVNGNYILSGTPSGFPIALLYVLKVKALYLSNLTFDNIIEAQNTLNVGTTAGTLAAGDDSRLQTNDPRKVKSPINITSTISHTGTTAETIKYATANLFGVFDIHDSLQIFLLLFGSNSGNTKTVRIYVSDSDTTLTNPVLIGLNTFTTAYATNNQMQKFLWFRGALNSQLVQQVANPSFLQVPQQAVAIDFGVSPKYIVITVQLVSGADTVQILNGWSNIYKP